MDNITMLFLCLALGRARLLQDNLPTSPKVEWSPVGKQSEFFSAINKYTEIFLSLGGTRTGKWHCLFE
jgi:hypothetical protein